MEVNKIYNEDCLKGMKQIPDGVIDMILCDLPYGTTNNFWDIRIPFEPLWKQYKRITKPNAAIVLFSQMPFGAELIMSNRKMFRYEWVWEKHLGAGFFLCNKMPLRCHENILVFYQQRPTYNPQFREGIAYSRKNLRKGGGCYTTTPRTDVQNDGKHYYPRDVLKFKSTVGLLKVRYHSTQKPVDLLEYLIKTYTNEGELVLDNCIGSGSTAVACVNTGRNFIGFETEKEYFDIACWRVEEAQAAKEMKLAV